MAQAETKNCNLRVSVIHVDHTAEPFVATSVPDVLLDLPLGPQGWSLPCLQVGTSDRGIVVIVKSILADS